MRVAAQDNAPTARGQFPLVVLTPGMGNNPVQQTVVASGLASLGYVVAVPSPTYSADVTVLKSTIVKRTAAGQRVPGNESVLSPLWVHDELFTADRLVAANADSSSPFHHHIDVAKVVYAGHSFGGATAVQACAEDRRCGAAVDVDGAFFGEPVTRTGLDRPLLIITSQGSCVAGRCRRNAADHEQLADAKALLQHSTDVKNVLEIRGAQHANFTDLGVWYFAEPVRFALQTTGVFGRIDGERALRAEIDCLAAFLDTQLDGASSHALRSAIARNPEARLILG
jgi:dienelactone hydrolase